MVRAMWRTPTSALIVLPAANRVTGNDAAAFVASVVAMNVHRCAVSADMPPNPAIPKRCRWSLGVAGHRQAQGMLHAAAGFLDRTGDSGCRRRIPNANPQRPNNDVMAPRPGFDELVSNFHHRILNQHRRMVDFHNGLQSANGCDCSAMSCRTSGPATLTPSSVESPNIRCTVSH